MDAAARRKRNGFDTKMHLFRWPDDRAGLEGLQHFINAR